MAWAYIHICELNCPLLVIEINFGRKRCFSKMSLHENWEWDQMWCPGSSLKLLQSRPLLWLGYPISSFQTLPNGIELKFRKLWSGHSNSCPTNSLPSLQMNRFMWVTSINRNLPLKVSQLGQPRGQYSIIQDLFPKLNIVWKLINQKLSQEFAMENAWAFSQLEFGAVLQVLKRWS